MSLLTANAPGPGGLLRIVSANDPNDVGQGFYVSTGVSPPGIDFSRPIGIAAGNFFGDGARQVVLAQPTTAGGSQFVVVVYRVAVNTTPTVFNVTGVPHGFVAAGGLRLTAHSGGKPTSAIFESEPSSARPSSRMEIKQSSPQRLDFTLQVSRAVLSRDSTLCSPGKASSTTLTTSFVIDDGQGKLVMAAAAMPWECLGKVPQQPSELRRR